MSPEQRAMLLRARLPAKPLGPAYKPRGLAQSKLPPRPPKREGVGWLTQPRKRPLRNPRGPIAAHYEAPKWLQEGHSKDTLTPQTKRQKKVSALTKISEQLPLKLKRKV